MTETAGLVVEPATAASDELVGAIQVLLRQLSSSASPPTKKELLEIIESRTTTLLVARDEEDGVVGMLTLACFRLPTGTRAWIEDVVVDEKHRGMGVGAALVARAMDLARDRGARTVDLTSRPSREAANRLYLRLGFVRRNTNVYRYELA